MINTMINLINPWNLLYDWEPWGNFIPEYRPGYYLKYQVKGEGPESPWWTAVSGGGDQE